MARFSQNPGGSGSDGDIADFIFTNNGGNSSITLPGAKQMDIISGDEEDLYVTSGDDLYLTALLDDVFIRANDDVKFVSNYDNDGTEYNWTMNSEGDFRIPGGIVAEDGTDLTLLAVSSAVVLNGNNGEFLNDSTVPGNQIATVEDIGVETDYVVLGGTEAPTEDQPTFTGDPLFTGSYIKMSSNLVHFQVQVDFDNITSFGTGQYFVTLPFPAKNAMMLRNGCLHRASNGNQYSINGHVAAGTTDLLLWYTAGTGQDQEFTHNNPYTLTTNDNFHIAGTYIAE